MSLPGRTLSAEAVEALQAASVQALERARRLEPLDRAALDAADDAMNWVRERRNRMRNAPTGETHIGLEEVRAVARAPARGGLALAAVGLGLAAALAWWASTEPLPPEPPGVAFSAAGCAVNPDPTCYDVLPEPLRALPDPQQYEAAVVAELVRTLDLPTDGSEPPLAAVRRQVRTDGRRRFPQVTWPDADHTAPLASGPTLADIAVARDWSVPTPPPPLVPPIHPDLEGRAVWAAEAAARHNRVVREEAAAIAERAAAWYDEARADALVRAWEDVERAYVREHDRLASVRSRAEAWAGALRLGSSALSALALALAASVAWLRPVRIVLSPYHLRVGRRRFDWTEVSSCHWAERPPRVQTRRGPVTVEGRTLTPQAVEALSAASDRAFERAKRLDALDRRALASLAELRQE